MGDAIVLFGSPLFTEIAGGTCAVDSDSQTARNWFFPEPVPVWERIANIAGLGKARTHARRARVGRKPGTQHHMPFLQEQWRIMKTRIIDQMLVYYYALGSLTTMWIRLHVTLLRGKYIPVKAVKGPRHSCEM